MHTDGDPKDPPQATDATDAKDAQNPTPGVVVEANAQESGRVVVKQQLPDTLFAFPLRRAVPFPALMMPLLLDSPESREIVAKAEAHNGHLFVVLQRDPEEETPGIDGIYEEGVIARVLKTLRLPDGNMSAMTQGLRRARRVKAVRQKPHLVVRVKEIVEIPAQGKKAESLARVLQQNLRKLTEPCSTSRTRRSSRTSRVACCERWRTASACLRLRTLNSDCSSCSSS